MDEIDVPQYFLCPISLQIMKDPVTTVTGITYDRESIEHWLSMAPATAAVLCPVTKLPLSRSADLTPNHMLWRLIQAWCIANAKNGVHRMPTPKTPLHRSAVIKLIRGVGSRRSSSENLEALKKMEELADDGDNNRTCMAEAGAAKSMILFVMRCFNEENLAGVGCALKILRLTWTPTVENKQVVEDNRGFFQSISWILNSKIENTAKTEALIVLKNVVEVEDSSFLQTLKPCFFKEMVRTLSRNISAPATRAVLKILIQSCPAGRNRLKIVDAGAVHELIEIELSSPEKKTTELIFYLLAQLCSCAEGRQQFLNHAGGVGVVAKRMLRVSPATDDRALCIYEWIARVSATRAVVAEMLTVGGVTKLCMILQADCEGYLKKKAREILRLHSKAWSSSPCIQVYLLTRYAR